MLLFTCQNLHVTEACVVMFRAFPFGILSSSNDKTNVKDKLKVE
jgi:hypothetical protein